MKNHHRQWMPIAGCVIAGLLAGCASKPDRQTHEEPAAVTKNPVAFKGTVAAADDEDFDDIDEYDIGHVPDPLEVVNRGVFVFNDGVYTYVLRPVARGYEFVVPSPVRRAMRNVFENARFPVRLVNNLLQANIPRAGQETGRFLVNTTAGVGGILRVSDRIPALSDVPPADTGQTLAKWGIPHGVYLVLPIFGPSSTRDSVGLVGDTALNPVSWVGFFYGGSFFAGPDWTIAIGSTHTVHTLPDRMDAYDALTGQALEKYLAVRSAWVQRRAAVAEQ